MESIKSLVMRVRLNDIELDKIDAAWPFQGFKSRSAYLRHAALLGIGEASAIPPVVDAMRGLTKELGSIGRNINQVIREMHRSRQAGITVDPESPLDVVELALLVRKIDELKETMKLYIVNTRPQRS